MQATAGLLADGRHVANRARDEADGYRSNYRNQIPLKVCPITVLHFCTLQVESRCGFKILADRVGLYCQAYTLYSSVRPFGLSAIIGGIDKIDGPALYCVEPSGVYWVSLVADTIERSGAFTYYLKRVTEGVQSARGGNWPRQKLKS